MRSYDVYDNFYQYTGTSNIFEILYGNPKMEKIVHTLDMWRGHPYYGNTCINMLKIYIEENLYKIKNTENHVAFSGVDESVCSLSI